MTDSAARPQPGRVQKIFFFSVLLASFALACAASTSSPPATGDRSDASTSGDPPPPPGDVHDGGTNETAPPPPAPPQSDFHSLPFSGGPDAPVVASLRVRCPASSPVVYVAIVVTDPNGVDDLAGLDTQSVGLFRNAAGTGAAETHEFYVTSTGSYFGGSSEGSFFGATADATLRQTICAADVWPAQVVVIDKTGHATTGKVLATRVQ